MGISITGISYVFANRPCCWYLQTHLAAALREVLIVVENAAGAIVNHVDASLIAHIREVKRADDVSTHACLLVGLTPVDIGPASDASSIQNPRGLHTLNVSHDRCPVLQTRSANLEGCTLIFQQLHEEATNPAIAPIDQELLLHLLRCALRDPEMKDDPKV